MYHQPSCIPKKKYELARRKVCVCCGGAVATGDLGREMELTVIWWQQAAKGDSCCFFPTIAEAFKITQINASGIWTWFCLNPTFFLVKHTFSLLVIKSCWTYCFDLHLQSLWHGGVCIFTQIYCFFNESKSLFMPSESSLFCFSVFQHSRAFLKRSSVSLLMSLKR